MDGLRIADIKNKLSVSKVVLEKLSYHEDVSTEMIEMSLSAFDEAIRMLNNLAGWRKKVSSDKEILQLLKERNQGIHPEKFRKSLDSREG